MLRLGFKTRYLCPASVTVQVQLGSGPTPSPAGRSEQLLPLTKAALEQKLSISEQGSFMNNLDCVACPHHSKPEQAPFQILSWALVGEGMPALPAQLRLLIPSKKSVFCHPGYIITVPYVN